MEVNQLTIVLYTKVFPFLSIFLTALFAYFVFFTPSSIKTMIKAWKSRSAGALMFIANDDGFVDVEWMKADMGQGLFMGKRTKYVITPRPRYIEETTDEKHPLKNLDPDAKDQIDQLIQTRHIMEGIGKPTYFGYKGKSIAVSPGLLNAMDHAPKEKAKPTLAQVRGESPPPVSDQSLSSIESHPFNNKITSEYAINLLDARTIKQYIPFTFSPSLIDALTFKHEQIGYFSRPMDKLKQNALPIGVVLIVIFVAYFLMTGKIKIPGLG